MQSSTKHNQFKKTKQNIIQEKKKKRKKEIREKGSQTLNLD